MAQFLCDRSQKYRINNIFSFYPNEIAQTARIRTIPRYNSREVALNRTQHSRMLACKSVILYFRKKSTYRL